MINDSKINPQGPLLPAGGGIKEPVTTEQTAQESDIRYRLLADVTMEGILIHHGGIITDCNPELLRLLGYRYEELIGKSFLDIAVFEADLGAARDSMLKEHTSPYCIRLKKKNAEIFFSEIEARNFMIDGETYRVLAIRDITEHKKIQDALRKSESRHRIIFENAPLGMILFNNEGSLSTATNPASGSWAHHAKNSSASTRRFKARPGCARQSRKPWPGKPRSSRTSTRPSPEA